MGVLVLLARQLGRANRVVNVLALTAVIMIMVNPLILRDDAGFQLSFLATLGLIYISPALQKYLSWLPKHFGFQESVLATMSATIATLPLIVFTFGRLSLVALIVNVLILAVIPLTMALGALAVLLAAIWWPLGWLMGWLVWVCLSYIVRIVEWFAAISWSSVDIPELHWFIVVGLFGLLAWFILPRLSLLRAPRKGFRYERQE
jgi:competence protein ComEC